MSNTANTINVTPNLIQINTGNDNNYIINNNNNDTTTKANNSIIKSFDDNSKKLYNNIQTGRHNTVNKISTVYDSFKTKANDWSKGLNTTISKLTKASNTLGTKCSSLQRPRILNRKIKNMDKNDNRFYTYDCIQNKFFLTRKGKMQNCINKVAKMHIGISKWSDTISMKGGKAMEVLTFLVTSPLLLLGRHGQILQKTISLVVGFICRAIFLAVLSLVHILPYAIAGATAVALVALIHLMPPVALGITAALIMQLYTVYTARRARKQVAALNAYINNNIANNTHQINHKNHNNNAFTIDSKFKNNNNYLKFSDINHVKFESIDDDVELGNNNNQTLNVKLSNSNKKSNYCLLTDVKLDSNNYDDYTSNDDDDSEILGGNSSNNNNKTFNNYNKINHLEIIDINDDIKTTKSNTVNNKQTDFNNNNNKDEQN